MEEAFSDYQVFIGHRGPDTKNTLASLLYHSLRRSGIRVFLDRDELSTGNSVSPQIKAVIIRSSIQIAIFSPKYAESPWCLEELCLMLQQRGHKSTIIPIFCGVKPSDLRRVNEGPYAEAFTKHKDRDRMEAARWEEALKNAAEIKGHEFHMEEGDWGEFVDKIVNIVHKKVRREPLLVAEHLVGFDMVVENLYNEISNKMDTIVDTIIVGISGLGGSGKTTLAAHLYNLKHTQYERSSFLYEVSRSRSALISLQKKLLFDLLGCSQLHIASPQEGVRLLQERLRRLSRVLIVLDGIDCEEQIESLLLPVKKVLVGGSLVVITSRDKGLLARCEISFLYDVKLLDEKDARELFLYHAFRETKEEALTVSEDLVREIVKICGGYPLALKVLGTQLFGKQKRHWEFLLKNLQNYQFPKEIVEKIVKATYDSLEEEAKEVFFYVASFFEGLNSYLVMRVEGEECPLLHWIETLGEKCLVEFHCIEVDVDGQVKYNDGGHEDLRPHKRSRLITSTQYRGCKIGMHKLVVDMAKKIASEERAPCLSSDYQLDYLHSDCFPQMLAKPPPHVIIQNCYRLKRFRHLKYEMVKVFYMDYHSEF